jgi:hypothetical protein
MPSWCNYHRIALIFGTLLQIIIFVYLQLNGGNLPYAVLKVLKSEQYRIVHLVTSVACVFSTTRFVGSRVGWLHSLDNLRPTLFPPSCRRFERWKWCAMPQQHLASWTVLTASTKSYLKASSSWRTWWPCNLKARLCCVRYPTKRKSWTKTSPYLKYVYSFFPSTCPFSFPPTLYTPPASWSQHHVTCTKNCLFFQNTPDYLHNFEQSLWASFRYTH